MSVTSWSPIDTIAVFGRQRPPARAMRGSAAAIVSGSSSIGVGSGHATVTSAPAGRQPLPQADRLDVADDVEDHDAAVELVGVEQRLLVVDHEGLVAARHRHRVPLRCARRCRARPGGDDDGVGLEREHIVGGRVDPQPHVDAAALALPDPPVGEVGELLAARELLRQADLAAELVAPARAASPRGRAPPRPTRLRDRPVPRRRRRRASRPPPDAACPRRAPPRDRRPGSSRS